MVSAAFWFALMTVLIALISGDMHPFQMVFFRNVFACMMFLPGIIYHGIGHVKTASIKAHWSRAISGTIGMLSWFYALTITPPNDAVALSFIVPIITTLLAVIFLKELVGWQRWLAMFIGFGGVLIILRPGSGAVGLGGLLVIASTFTWAVSNILIKKLAGIDRPRVIAFYMTLFMIPLSLPFAITTWQTPTAETLLWLIAVAFAANMAQLSLASSYSKADISDVLPFDFSRLIFVSIFSYFLFEQVIDIWTIIGALVIFASAVYIVKRQNYERKTMVKAAKATQDEGAPVE